MHAMRKYRLGVEDYLAGERDGEVRHDYVGGEVYAMTGASDRHGLIAGAIHALLYQPARRKGCQLFVSDMKVRIRRAGEEVFYYPDLLLACDSDDRATYYRERPCLLVEVLSEGTERIDRREKLYAYTAIPSLSEYLLVAQDRRQIDIYRRTADDWERETLAGGTFRLHCLDVEVSVDDVYADVEWGPASA